MRLHLTNATLIAGSIASMTTPAAYAAGMAQVAAGSDSALNLTFPEIALGTTIVGGVITALTFIFKLFLRSRDATEKALTDRIAALEVENAEARREQTNLNTRIIDLLQGALLDNRNVMQALTTQVLAMQTVNAELVESIQGSRVAEQEEHTRILAAIGHITSAYPDNRAREAPNT